MFNQQVGPVCLPFQHAPDTFAGNYVDLLGMIDQLLTERTVLHGIYAFL